MAGPQINICAGSGESTNECQDSPDSRRLANLWAFITAGLTIIWSSLILVSWQLNLQPFKDLMAGNPPTKVNAAVCGLLSAASLLLLNRKTGSWQLKAGRACALLVFLLAALTLAEYVLGKDIGIDEILMKETTVVALAPDAGRMALAAAISYAFLSIALIGLDWKAGKEYLSQGAGVAVLAIAMLSVLGYLYEAAGFRTFGPFNQIALPTICLLACLGTGVMAARPDRGLVSILLSRSRSGVIARQLLPLVILVPVGLGWLRLAGETAGYYDTRFGLAVMVVLMSLFLSAAVIWTASTLYRADSKQSQADAMLQALADELTDLYNQSPCGYQSINQDGLVARANATALSWLGYSGEEVIGKKRFQDLLAEDHRASFTQEFSRLLTAGTAQELEFNMLRKDGSTFPALLKALALRDAAGNFRVCRISIFDITDRKKLDEAAKLARDSALEALQLKSAFIATISHELRTPLSGILGVNELLLADELSDFQRESAETIQSCGHLLLGLVNDILDFSKIESGHMKIESLQFNLLSVVDEVIAMVESTARRKNLRLVKELGANIPSVLAGDPARLKQVLLNLLGNAIKFTDEGEVRLSLIIESNENDHVRLKLLVSDTGIGIAEDMQKFLFLPFSQVDSSFTRRYGGTGLGLTISKRLVELMGGRIGCESQKGKGSTFWVTIPLRRTIDSPGVTRPAPPSTTEPTLSGDILVIEDDRILQMLTMKQLDRLGLRSRIVGTAEEGLKCMDESHFSLVLMDCHLPQMDGFEATREIRRRETRLGNHIPVLAMTASVMRADLTKCLEAGMDDCISKPYTLEELRAKLSRWLPR